SASAPQVTSMPPPEIAPALTPVGGGGGVVSPTAPVRTYSIQARATRSSGSQTASAGSPLKSATGTASAPSTGASQARDGSTALSFEPPDPSSGNRAARQTSKNGIARRRESPHSWSVRGSAAKPIGAPLAR